MMGLTRAGLFSARLFLMLVATALVGGCSLEDVDAPALSGPSEFSTSVTLAAVPDQLPRDGNSQSVVTLIVRDEAGRPVSGLRLTLGVIPSTARLSAAEVVTDASGRATISVTAPPSTALGNAVTVFATPVGTGADSLITRTVTIALIGTSNTTAPTASFTVTPTAPEVNQVTTLDASASTDEGAVCRDVCTYSWDLGGEAARTGRIIAYQFQTARIYSVALTVTDVAGVSATTRTNVTVSAANKPTITLSVSPASPTAAQPAIFTATTTVATNHRVTAINWNFGDGSTATTTNATVQKTFSNTGTFPVIATVTDDLGQTASATISVTVGSGITFPDPAFTASPTPVRPGVATIFNGSGVTTSGGTSIKTWEWDFGDASDSVKEDDPSVSHTFPAATEDKTYVVRLTVTDTEGRTATASRSILVDAP